MVATLLLTARPCARCPGCILSALVGIEYNEWWFRKSVNQQHGDQCCSAAGHAALVLKPGPRISKSCKAIILPYFIWKNCSNLNCHAHTCRGSWLVLRQDQRERRQLQLLKKCLALRQWNKMLFCSVGREKVRKHVFVLKIVIIVLKSSFPVGWNAEPHALQFGNHNTPGWPGVLWARQNTCFDGTQFIFIQQGDLPPRNGGC